MNKSKRILIVILLFASSKSYSQWEQSMGTENLDVQSLLSTTDYLFFGGATGAYRSGDDAYSFAYSNNGNDDVGPTRGFAQDENYIYTCTSQGVFRSSDMGVSWIPKSEGALSGAGFSTNLSTSLKSFSISFPDIIPYLSVSSNLILSTEKILLFLSSKISNNPLVQLGSPTQMVSPSNTAKGLSPTKSFAQYMA